MSKTNSTPKPRPLFIRTISQRASEKIEGEPDEVVIAIAPGDARPEKGSPYPIADMDDNLVVTGMWDAGKAPGDLNELTHDAPGGYTIVRLRVVPDKETTA